MRVRWFEGIEPLTILLSIFKPSKMYKDYLKIAVRNLLNRKMRSFLTVLGIVIGIVAVVALISVGEGMQQAINAEFKTVGQDRIIIKPGGGSFSGSTPVTSDFSTKKLYERDIEIIKSVKGVDNAIGAIIETGDVEFDNTIKYLSVFGIQTDIQSTNLVKDIDFFIVEKGRQFMPGDKYRAIVGYRTADKTFNKDIKTSHKIIVKGQEFKVVGVQKKSGSPIHDAMVRIPVEVARELFEKESGEFSTIFAKVDAGSKPSEVAEDIEKALRRDHNVEEGEEDFTVTTSAQMIEGFNNILGVVEIVLIGIATISLIVGGIGIMNTMYTSVLQRRKEIGIMKSIGAKNMDILFIFILESGLLGIIGGVVGVLIGLALSKGVEAVALIYGVELLKAYVSIPLVISALLFSFIVGSLSGLMPAMQAAKLKPVDSLRGL